MIADKMRPLAAADWAFFFHRNLKLNAHNRGLILGAKNFCLGSETPRPVRAATTNASPCCCFESSLHYYSPHIAIMDWSMLLVHDS